MTDEMTTDDTYMTAAVVGGETDPEAERIVSEIVETRSELEQTIGEIGNRLAPETVAAEARDKIREATVGRVERMVDDAGQTAGRTKNTVIETIRENPAPAALAALGVGWLALRFRDNQSSGSSQRYMAGNGHSNGNGNGNGNGYGYAGVSYGGSDFSSSAYGGGTGYGGSNAGGYGGSTGGSDPMSTVRDAAGRMTSGVQDTASHAMTGVQDTASQAMAGVQDMAGQAIGTAQGLADQAVTGVQDVASQVAGRAQQVGTEAQRAAQTAAQTAQQGAQDLRWQAIGAVSQLQSTVDRTLQTNPMMLGAIAVAAGAVTGLVIKETQKERELYGEPRDRLLSNAADVATQALDQAGQRANEMGEQLRSDG